MTTYHYYPTTTTRYPPIRSSAPTFDRMTTSRNTRSVSPPLPGLSRASTPESNAPPTPVLPSSFPQSSKMAPHKPSVGFPSSVVTSSYRIPDWDERSVMRAFASHAGHCRRCCDPERTLQDRDTLCRTGTELAKDIGKYFYCWDGKPYSQIDRKHRQERVQVEVPVEYSIIKNLFEALQQGLGFESLKQRRPEIHQSKSAPAPTRSATVKENYELKPSATSAPRRRATTYTGYGETPEYETRTPHDDRYRHQSSTSSKPRESRRDKRGSLYVPDDRREKRKSYVVPFSSGWLA